MLRGSPSSCRVSAPACQPGLPDERYLHWDDLRRRHPPSGLTLEAWWAALKLGRLVKKRTIPSFVDIVGEPFSWTASDKVMEHVHFIDLWAGGLIGLTEPDTGASGPAASVIANRETQGQYLMRSLINEAISSSQLEGASTTREVAQGMLLSQRKPRDLNERMILNNYLTMKRISELKTAPLKPELVFELHRLVTADTLDKPDAAGRFRRPDEDIAVFDNANKVLHQPPAAATLPSRFRAMRDFAIAGYAKALRRQEGGRRAIARRGPARVRGPLQPSSARASEPRAEAPGAALHHRRAPGPPGRRLPDRPH